LKRKKRMMTWRKICPVEKSRFNIKREKPAYERRMRECTWGFGAGTEIVALAVTLGTVALTVTLAGMVA